MVKPLVRTKSIGTKVTEEDYAKLERTAQAGGKTLGQIDARKPAREA